MNTTQNSTKSKIVKVIGVDLAKDHCDVIGYDENGKICLRLDGCSYAKLREILSNLPQAVVLMEACKGSMFHARSIADLGHEVRLVKGADVKALRNINHKNDLRDAAYIAKLYFVPGTTYVYIKSQQQQSLQFLQNEYKSLQELRIQAGNQIHAGLEEFGCPVRKSSKFIKTRMVAHLEKHAELIPEDVMASFKRRREIWLNLLQHDGSLRWTSDGSRTAGSCWRRLRALQEQQAVCGLPRACTKAEQHRRQQHAQPHHQMWAQEASLQSRAVRATRPHVRGKVEGEFR